jgi:hypothetical protein
MTTIFGGNRSSGYDVDNSLRFNDGSSDYLNRTPGSASNRRTITFSCWFKKGLNAATWSWLMHSGASNDGTPSFGVGLKSDSLSVIDLGADGAYDINFITSRKFKDPAAWYHVVVAIDTTQSTESNRVKIYVNGVQETSFSTATYPGENHDFNTGPTMTNYAIEIGRDNYGGGEGYYDGYMAEMALIDGSQLAPTSFGEFDEDSLVWKPIDFKNDVTFGTNGFYFEFNGSGTSANSSGLGADTSGNDHHFAVNNLTAVDQSTDTCTNNFATLNSINNFYAQATLSEGNLNISTNNSNECFNTSTLGASSGKWYMEVKIITTTASIRFYSGVTYRNPDATSDWLGNNFYSWGYRSPDGKLYNEQSEVYTGATLADGDIIGIAMDLDNHKLYTHKAGTYNNSGDPTSGATGTGAAALDSGETYFFAVGDTGAVAAGSVNFGSPSFAISSGNSDARGHGNFEYAVPSGYFALCTKNLAEFG